MKKDLPNCVLDGSFLFCPTSNRIEKVKICKMWICGKLGGNVDNFIDKYTCQGVIRGLF